MAQVQRTMRAMTEPTQSIAQLIAETADLFDLAQLHFGHGTTNATDEAAWLVLWVLGLPYDPGEQTLKQPVTASQRARVVALREQRMATRQPMAYLLGEAWFAGQRLVSDARALVPRSSFAELIMARFEPWVTEEPQRILDLCTGGGCIAIACAYAFPQAHIDASDLSPDALALAMENVALHQLAGRVHLHRSNLFDQLPKQHYDLIVSNPPYVGSEEMQTLPEEYRHEPVMGLETEEAGLYLVRRILEQASQFLSPQGWLVVEVGNSEVAMMQRWPECPATWIDFEHSEGGIFIISASELTAWQQQRHQYLTHVRQ